MIRAIIVIINLINFQITESHVYGDVYNHHRIKLDKTNVVNKGVWIKNTGYEHSFDRPTNHFFLKETSLDADNMLQGNADVFAADGFDQEPSITTYVTRSKRSPEYIRKHRPRKSGSKKAKRNSNNEPMFTKSKMPDFKPLFNEYPFKMTDLLNEDTRIDQLKRNFVNENATANVTAAPVALFQVNTETPAFINENMTEDFKTTAENVYKLDDDVDNNELNTNDSLNDTDKSERSKKSNDRYDKSRVMWHQNAPIPADSNIFTDTNIYEVVQKDDKTRVTERGLIKVISMLTKTFKRIMKQHSEIKQIHGKILKINNDLKKQIDEAGVKFQDFDSKYSDMVQFSDKIKKFEDKMSAETANLQKKQIEMDNNIIEFENQQKKFLTQQRQFYNIQKLMIAQNEKINLKQNMIAKTQSEISHRQNNFARILKKAKQVFYENKVPHQYNESQREIVEVTEPTHEAYTTSLPSTENIKINLFSIPAKTKLENKDELILKEKDLPIDELVYKYYFNNTFIDGLMKSKILSNFATNTHNIEIARNTKNKRDKPATTLLLPVHKEIKNIRNKRWIDRLVKKKRKHTQEENSNKILSKSAQDENEMKKTDPFTKMAKKFCIEIEQDYDKQTLEWCIEKTLRRLRVMDKRVLPEHDPMTENNVKQLNQMIEEAHLDRTPSWMTPNYSKVTKPSTVIIMPTSKMTASPIVMSSPPVTPKDDVTTKHYADSRIFFPDNDELESNLAKYDIKPDTEGNVYYDGSFHFSDYGRRSVPGTESGGMSDVMPGLTDSNSKFELDTYTFDLQAKRRAYVRKLNENILKQLKAG